MYNAMILSFALFAETVVTHALGAVLIAAALAGTMATVWWGTGGRPRATAGGPVISATSRDYVAVAAIMTLAVACMLTGLYLWKH